jgi:hypothetical protein
MSATRDAASFIVSIAREKNIKLILGSWEQGTREILKAGLNYDAAPLYIMSKLKVLEIAYIPARPPALIILIQSNTI